MTCQLIGNYCNREFDLYFTTNKDFYSIKMHQEKEIVSAVAVEKLKVVGRCEARSNRVGGKTKVGMGAKMEGGRGATLRFQKPPVSVLLSLAVSSLGQRRVQH